MKPKIFIPVIILVGLFGCKPKNQSANVPTYIHIDSFSFNTPGAEQGSSSHDIKTVFVFYNNAPLGVFDLPATFPVLANGTGKLEVQPGIAEDGLSDFQSAYPFYTTDTFTFTANPGGTINHIPVTGYFQNAKVVFSEDFEVHNQFINENAAATDSIVITHDAAKVFEGYGAGYVSLNTPGDLVEEVQQTQPFTIDGVTYLEINYRSDIAFTIGLYGDLYGRIYYIGGLNASSGVWKKAYFNLSEFPTSYPSNNYLIGFKTVLPTGQSSGYLSLDNIKVVKF